MDRKPFPSETQDRFILRLPDGLRDRVAEAAKAADRSMNAEFVRRIEQSFKPSTDDGAMRILIRIAAHAADAQRYLHNARKELVKLATAFLAVTSRIPRSVIDGDEKLKSDIEQWTEMAKGFSEYFDDLTPEERIKMENADDVLKAISDAFNALKKEHEARDLVAKEDNRAGLDRPHED